MARSHKCKKDLKLIFFCRQCEQHIVGTLWYKHALMLLVWARLYWPRESCETNKLKTHEFKPRHKLYKCCWDSLVCNYGFYKIPLANHSTRKNDHMQAPIRSFKNSSQVMVCGVRNLNTLLVADQFLPRKILLGLHFVYFSQNLWSHPCQVLKMNKKLSEWTTFCSCR